jgi:hypothetical protein
MRDAPAVLGKRRLEREGTVNKAGDSLPVLPFSTPPVMDCSVTGAYNGRVVVWGPPSSSRSQRSSILPASKHPWLKLYSMAVLS